MKERKIPRDANLDRLVADLRALPSKPVGDHLLDDEFIGYAAETLGPQEVVHIDAHLASCIDCTIEMEGLVEASEMWSGEKGEQRLAALEARVRGAIPMPSDSERTSSPPKLNRRLRKIAASMQRWWKGSAGTRAALGPAQCEIIRDVTRDLLERLDRRALLLFEPISDAFFRDPQKVLTGGYRQEMLGFGLETGEVLLTPAALVVVTQLVQDVEERVRDSLGEEGSDPASIEMIKQTFSHYASSGTEKRMPPLHWSKKELEHIKKRAVETACRVNLPEKDASELAEVLVGSLT